jgi:hypothetical protein
LVANAIWFASATCHPNEEPSVRLHRKIRTAEQGNCRVLSAVHPTHLASEAGLPALRVSSSSLQSFYLLGSKFPEAFNGLMLFNRFPQSVQFRPGFLQLGAQVANLSFS